MIESGMNLMLLALAIGVQSGAVLLRQGRQDWEGGGGSGLSLRWVLLNLRCPRTINLEILKRQLDMQVWGLSDVWTRGLEFISLKMLFTSRAIDGMTLGEMREEKERRGLRTEP